MTSLPTTAQPRPRSAAYSCPPHGQASMFKRSACHRRYRTRIVHVLRLGQFFPIQNSSTEMNGIFRAAMQLSCLQRLAVKAPAKAIPCRCKLGQIIRQAPDRALPGINRSRCPDDVFQLRTRHRSSTAPSGSTTRQTALSAASPACAHYPQQSTPAILPTAL